MRFQNRRRSDGPARLGPAQPGDRLHEHALELGQPDDAPVVVADGRQVAHLGDGEEALVARVVARDAVKDVHVLDRRQPLDVEVG